MYSCSSSRERPAALRRKVLGLLTVLWLNMAVLPCAMAFESSESCPHCPPAGEHEMASHHGHSEVQAEPPCASVQAECCDLVDASVDTRGGKLKVKPASDVAFVPAPAMAELPLRTSVQRCALSDPPDIVGSSPPLHVLFCVYLK